MKLNDIPQKPGVYLMRDVSGRIIYIGKAKNLKNRISSYFSDTPKTFKINLLIERIKNIDYIVASSEREAFLIEDKLIKTLQPFYNVLLRDDKSYPYLILTLSEKYPALLISRRPSKSTDSVSSKDEYYGPFPHARLKNLIPLLNKIFNLRTCKHTDLETNKNRFLSCLYLQTNKCPAPCVGKISHEAYHKNVKALRAFLKHGLGNFEKKLMEEIKTLSKNLEFEKAAQLKAILVSVKNMLMRVRFSEVKLSDIETASTHTNSLKNLKDVLKLSRFPASIECVDISNLGTDAAAGAVVRFHLNEVDKSHYRRYKIKDPLLLKQQNDYAMISEVIRRHYTRLLKENNLPDLVVIDGGKGQLNAAIASLKELNLAGKIDIISISKSPHIDVIHTTSKSFKLSKDDASLLLIQRIRDEAHRFALSYHRKLREKTLKKVR